MPATFTPVIALHVAAALLALAVGAFLFLMRKGNRLHRLAGRAWIALMLVSALSSFWIQAQGHFTAIHLLSVGTLFALAGIVFYAATGRIRLHRITVIATYVGALLVAGAFALMPHRLLGQIVWPGLGLG